jgi:hypothetical protein
MNPVVPSWKLATLAGSSRFVGRHLQRPARGIPIFTPDGQELTMDDDKAEPGHRVHDRPHVPGACGG